MTKHAIMALCILAAVPATAAEYLDGWSDQELTRLSQSCMIGMKFYTRIRYMQENKIAEKDLPADFEIQLDSMTEQFQPQCDCIADKIAIKYSLEDYKQDMKKVYTEYTQKILASGQCGEALTS